MQTGRRLETFARGVAMVICSSWPCVGVRNRVVTLDAGDAKVLKPGVQPACASSTIAKEIGHHPGQIDPRQPQLDAEARQRVRSSWQQTER
jgi:hypothetical protein